MANKSNFYKLEMLILSVLKNEDCYGYQINKWIREKSNGEILIGDGTMYNILYKLLDEKYISSYERKVGRKIRVYYHIETEGLAYLEELIEEFNKMVDIVRNITQQKEC